MSVNGPACKGCAFFDQGTIFIPERGLDTYGVLIVGDSGWINEAATTRDHLKYGRVGTPFSGPSGWFMERNLQRVGLDLQNFLIANTAWCKAPRLGLMDYPEKYPEAAEAIRHCRPYLDELIEERKPRIIVPMGNVALRRITGQTGIERNHGYILPTIYGIPALPTFHPSFIMQGNQKFAGVWAHLLKRAVSIAAGGLDPYPTYELLLDPSYEEAERYLLDPSRFNDYLICDIETNESPSGDEDEAHDFTWQIVRISFSNRAGTAISFPWQGKFIDIATRALALYTNVVFWNQAFDVPRLNAAGATVKGRIHDAMWAWHFLQSDLPKKLGFAAPLLVNCQPWKHLSSSSPAFYSAMDSAITGACWDEIRKQLTAEDRWDAFMEQCTDLLPITGHSTKEGMLIDVKAKSALLNVDNTKGPLGTLTQERNALFTKIQDQVPPACRPFKMYKKKPPKKLHLGETYFPKMVDQFGFDMNEGGKLLKPFNPASSDQRKRLFDAYGIKIPFNKKEDKESVEMKHLRKWSHKYPVMKDIMDYTERQKIITSYDWETDANGYIHPEFGFNPSTWRKSARNPNIQTIPKRSDLAKAFRSLFIAPPGYLYVECDSSAIEAVLVGFFGNSPEYIALAKRGVHRWLAEKFAGRPVSKKEPLYDKIKRIVHLSNYLGSPIRIAEEYPDDFANVAEARKLQDFYFSQPEIAPVRQWQQNTLSIADHDHYLETPFKQRHYFYDVLTKRNGKVVLGNDGKRAIAFMPQATASAIQTRFIHNLPLSLQLCIRAIIHDSIVMLVPAETAMEAAQTLYNVMTDLIPELGGLTIGAECSIGPDLGHMEAVNFK